MSLPPAETILPRNLDAERAVLGAVLVNNSLFPRAAHALEPTDFFRAGHRFIWQALSALLEPSGGAADLVMLKSALERAGWLEDCGGAAELARLTDGLPRSVNVDHYAALVKDASVRRQIIAMAATLSAKAAGEGTAADIVADADAAIVALQLRRSGTMVDLRTLQSPYLQQLIDRGEHRGGLLGVDTGFPRLNDLTNGWQPGHMIVIAARPSQGKSALTLNMALSAASAGGSVAVFSLEMTRDEVMDRMLATLSGVRLSRIKSGFLGSDDYAAVNAAMARWGQLSIHVDDSTGQTFGRIRSQCRRLKAEHGLALVIVDYVQLIRNRNRPKGETRNDELTAVSSGLKELAKDLRVPVIVLSQLNRGIEGRSDGQPRMSDLRETGALEQDADIVAFLHAESHRVDGERLFIVEKDRNGETGTITLSFERGTQRFTDPGAEPAQPALPHTSKPRRPPKVT